MTRPRTIPPSGTIAAARAAQQAFLARPLIEQLETSLDLLASIIVHVDEKYTPLFERLERNLEREKNTGSALARARQRAMAQSLEEKERAGL